MRLSGNGAAIFKMYKNKLQPLDYVLGGSLALILQNEMPVSRNVSDCDVASMLDNVDIDFPLSTRSFRSGNRSESMMENTAEGTAHRTHDRLFDFINVDFFIVPNLKVKTIFVNGIATKVQDSNQIWEAKERYSRLLRKKGRVRNKHSFDLLRRHDWKVEGLLDNLESLNDIKI